MKEKVNTLRKKIILGIAIIALIFIIIILILRSSLFNIKNIIVKNNQKVSTEEIITNSTLQVGSNMFKTFKKTIKDGVKKNPYIDDVKVSRKLDGEIILEVTEREATYMLKKENEYAYINNQGYILEISTEPINVPIITGYSTEEIEPGQRIDIKDLKKLESIIQIKESATNNGIKDIITSIDISNENNIILEIASEGKTVEFGDFSNIDIKVLWIVKLIEETKGEEGTIFLNVSDIKKVYFREKV